MSDRPPDTGSVKELMASSLRPHTRQIAIVAGLSVLMIASTIVLPLLIGLAINEMTLGRLTPALLAAGGIALLGLAFGVVIGARGIVAARLSLRIEHSLRSRLYAHLHSIDPSTLSRRSTGEWVSLTTVDLIPISSFFGLNLSKLATAVFTLLGAGIVMFTINPLLALLALAPTPLTVISVIRYRQAARPILTDLRQRIGELTSLVQENIAGAAAIRAAGREAEEMRRFERAGDAVLEQALASNRRLATFNPAVQTLPSVGSAIVVIVGGLLAIRGSFSRQLHGLLHVPADAGPVAADDRHGDRAGGDGPRLRPSGGSGPRARARGCRRRGFRAGRGSVDRPGSRQRPGLRRPDGGRGSGSARRARRQHRHRRHDRLRQVGPRPLGERSRSRGRRRGERRRDPARGSGSRLAAAADRLHRRRRVPVRRDDRGEHRVRAPEASREEIEAAARAAEAHDFIAEMPDGYETTIGDRGAGLSGGQRQRVALARALTASPDALILDNATGSLDALTEAAVLRNLDSHHAENPPTRVVVGYRPALLREVDEVLVIDDGRIVERGSHDELLASSERYRRLVGAE